MVETGAAERIGLTVRGVTTRGVKVPLAFVLGTSAAVVRAVPLLLVDVQTEEGPVGRTYLFCYTPSGARAVAVHLAEAVDSVLGCPAAPGVLMPLLERRYTLLGITGTVRMALSALDMALWDAAAIAVGQPPAAVLGAVPRAVPAYDSRGLDLMAPARLGDEADELLAHGGLKALELRLGHATLAEDLAALRAVRARIPSDVAVMVDDNQALSVAEALARGRALEAEGIAWLEEPIRHDDYPGAATLARALDVPSRSAGTSTGPRRCWRRFRPTPAIWSCPTRRGSAA